MSTPFTTISVQELDQRRMDGWQPFVLDVRAKDEADHLSLTFVDLQHPHTAITEVIEQLPRDRDIVVHCKAGGRSAMAATVLASQGFTRLFNLDGGITAWDHQIGHDLVRA